MDKQYANKPNHALTQQSERKLPIVGQDLVRHTFEPTASGNLPMRMIRGTVESSKLLPPSSFSQLVKHKLCCKFGCIHDLRVAILKHTITTHVKDFVAAVMISSCKDLIESVLQSLQDHHQLYQQLMVHSRYVQSSSTRCRHLYQSHRTRLLSVYHSSRPYTSNNDPRRLWSAMKI